MKCNCPRCKTEVGFDKVIMNVCKHCGFKTLDEKDMHEHLQDKHPKSKYLQWMR